MVLVDGRVKEGAVIVGGAVEVELGAERENGVVEVALEVPNDGAVKLAEGVLVGAAGAVKLEATGLVKAELAGAVEEKAVLLVVEGFENPPKPAVLVAFVEGAIKLVDVAAGALNEVVVTGAPNDVDEAGAPNDVVVAGALNGVAPVVVGFDPNALPPKAFDPKAPELKVGAVLPKAGVVDVLPNAGVALVVEPNAGAAVVVDEPKAGVALNEEPKVGVVEDVPKAEVPKADGVEVEADG